MNWNLIPPLSAYAQLVRLPNVFTALADIGLAVLAVHGLSAQSLPEHWSLVAGCLLAASACLYSAGMVWNDFFDVDQDRRERPFRPLPSGRVSRTTAARLGLGLLCAGLAFAALAGWRGQDWNGRALLVAGALALMILLYDSWLKRTWAGPLGMGSCRFLNVLLGLSVANELYRPWAFHLALIVGLYIVGVTWFARTEARISNQSSLASAAAVMLAALLLALPLPALMVPGSSSPLFPYLLVGFGFLVGIPLGKAIAHPTPPLVQAAVKRAILGLVVLDAILASALAGTAALLLVVLLIPALYLGRWIYST